MTGARRIAWVVGVGIWIGLLTAPLNIGVSKVAANVAAIDPRLGRSVLIAALVAAGGLLHLAFARLGRTPRFAGKGQALAERLKKRALRLDPFRNYLLVALVAFAALLPLTGNLYYVSVGTTTAIYVGLALGLNIVVGQAGLLVLGYAAFYAAGAYAYGILHREFGVSFWIGLPAGAIVAALFGVLLGAPTLRLRGDYLAIVTLGFGEMMRVLLITTDRLTGGPNGVSRIPGPRLFGQAVGDGGLYLLALGLVVLTTVVSHRLTCSRLGRAWMAMREDETAARAMGIDITRMRLLAFSLSAMWAGLCGVFFAAKQGFISPESFTFLESVTVLAMVILGGMGSIPGVITGAVLLALLPEALRQFSDYRMILLAGIMIVMMLFRPQGLFPNQRRRLELEEPQPEARP